MNTTTQRSELNCRAWLEMRKKVQKIYFSTMLRGFSHNMTVDAGHFQLAVSTKAHSPRCLLHHEYPSSSWTPGEACALCWGMFPGQHGFIHSWGLITALGPLLASLLLRMGQLGAAWPGAAPPGQILCLVLAKGCQAGWVQKTHMANFI